MITKSNLRDLLLKIKFSSYGDIMEKVFSAYSCSLKVDFRNQKLIYPDTIKGRERNDGFDAPENFVVFECVNRLLEKGYRPEDIELEKEWHLGHDAKSGRADICVSYNEEMLFIIECKTAGREFDKAYKDTINDGGQLFSYWQQERATKWLVLYTSDLIDDEVIYSAPTINCSDDKNIEQLAKKDTDIKLYKNAFTAEQKYFVWKETYSGQMFDNLIFADETKAYEIGIKPLYKKDLKDFSPEDKIVNKFEEILRHNNVSDKENAFNRLVALFICKLVDEITKSENDVVEFQYKQGTDTYETLQDRLQKLHTDGMEKFMKEKIFYVPNDYPEWLFTTYTGHQRKKAIEDLKEKIRILKFYSNNDFSFKDVHNEELFYQNGKILVEAVQLFEKYRIVYPSKHQFLGDLFEQLLSKGFKQNEGQFFTPIPITRFIWDSLPIQNTVHTEKGFSYPKVIDYACGAGHFLTEAVEAINTFAESENNDWVREHIFGIEKDYRLARVSKISMFMNGAGEANIIFGDGLENQPEKGIENNIFDILVANPPYAVKDFKQHLQLKNNTFDLLNCIGDNGSEIEVLFIERIAQLLKPKGIAAVILPSSILSNDSASYTGAREQLLQNFLIRAIVQFGSKTFGATGTNTVVLFLEKYNEPPKRKDMVTDSINAILDGSDLAEWEDKEIFEGYTKQIEISEDVYNEFIKQNYSLEDLSEIEYFKTLLSAFNTKADIVKFKNQKTFLKLSGTEQTEELKRKFYEFAKKFEFEKMFYFALLQNQNTLIITAPADNAKQKEFLGYDWSNRKGAEGIQIVTPGGKMYNDGDRKADNTLASAVRQSYVNGIAYISEENQAYANVVRTADMLDYSRVNFNKAIRTTEKKSIIIKSKYPLVSLNKITQDIKKGKAITSNEIVAGDYKVVAGGKDFAYKHKEYNRDENVITVSASGANAGLVNYWNEKIYASDCTTIQTDNIITTKWIYYYLQSVQEQIYSVLQRGAAQPHVYPDDIKLIPIPDITIGLQQQIVDECEKIDEIYNSTRMSIEEYCQKIKKLFDELEAITKNSDGYKLSLSDKKSFIVSIGKRVLNSELITNGSIPVYSANVFEPFGYIDKLLITDFAKDSVLWGIDGDWMVNFVSNGNPFYPTDHCGVLRVITDKVNPRYMARILEKEGKRLNFSRNYRASIDRIEGISFEVPPIKEQNKVIDKVLKLETQIKTLENSLLDIQKQKSDVIRKYL